MPLPGQLTQRFQPLFENEAVLVVCTSTALVMLGQGLIGPILPLYAKSFGVSAAAIGTTLSAFAFARMLFNVPSGLAADRWGRRVLLVGGPLLAGLGNVLSGTASTFALLLAWRFVAGIGSAMYMTGAAIVITDVATDANRGRLMALNQGALLFGVTIGPAVGGIIAEIAGLRAPFYFVGVTTLAAAVWNFARVPETRGTSTTQRRTQRSARSGSFGVLLIPAFLLASFVSTGVFFARSGRQAILPLFGDAEIGLSEGPIGVVLAVMALVNLVLTFPAGAMVDRFGARATILPSAALSLVGYLLFIPSTSAAAFWGAAMVLAVGSGILGPAPSAFAAAVAPADRRGAAMGLFRTISDAGFVVGPPLLGFIVDRWGYGWALATNGFALFLPALAFALLAGAAANRSRRPPTITATPG